MLPSNLGRDLILNIRPISELGSEFSRLISIPAGYTLGQLYHVVCSCFNYDLKALTAAGLEHDPYFYVHKGEIDDIDEIMRFGAPTTLVTYCPVTVIIDALSEGETEMLPWTCTTVDMVFDWPSNEEIFLFLQLWGWNGPNELIHVIEKVGYSTELTAKAKFIGGHGQVSIVNNEFRLDTAASSRFPAELQLIGERLRSSKVEEEIAQAAWALPLDYIN